MEQHTLPDAKVIAGSRDTVAVASHVDNDHKSMEVEEKGRKVRRCTIYPNISCEDHVRTSEVGKKYLAGIGRWEAPMSIWTDPKGKELFKLQGAVGPPAFLQGLKRALNKVEGDRISKEDYDRQAVPLDEADAAMKEGKYKIAIEGYKAARGPIEALKKLADKALADLQSIGQNLLNRGRKAIDSSRREQARELLKIVAADFEGLECAREAAEILKKLDSEVKDQNK